MVKLAECSPENLHLCGAPPVSFSFSKEAMCEEGTLTVLFAICFFVILFIAKQWLYRPLLARYHQGLIKRAAVKSHMVEEILIKPFIPTTVESYVAFLYFAWFLLTVPMAITRFYEKRWANQALTQQGPFNLLSRAIGCEGFDITALPYTTELSDLHPAKTKLLPSFLKFLRRKKPSGIVSDLEQDHFKSIDFLFTLHLAIGLGWLTVGFVQIFWVQNGWSVSILDG